MKRSTPLKNLYQNLSKLEELVKVQSQHGNWDNNPYMHGMANGMILAVSVLLEQEPEYLEAPEMFLEDAKLLDKLHKSGIIIK